jgi:phosphoribosylglycinamide formyltransferase-1
MQAIIDACKAGRLDAVPSVVISNNSRSGAMRRAAREGIPRHHLSSHTHPDPDALDRAICDVLEKHRVELVVLAGYMRKLGPRTLARFRGRIVNIHPALLPQFGGKGMYGLRVHAAVLAAGVKETGVTVHLVSQEYDQGPILAQRRVPVDSQDGVESLAARVLECEHALYPETLQRIASGEIALPQPGHHEERCENT